MQEFLILLKLGKRDHLEALRQEGLLYMNPLAYFSKLELDAARADRLEGTTRIIQPKHVGEFKFSHPILGEHRVPPGDLAGPVLISMNRIASCNIYCMFAITKPIDGEILDARNLEFGDSFVLILNTQEFINRMNKAAKISHLAGERKLVEYYDPEEYSGDTGPFRKSSAFAHQNEFRLILRPGSDEAIKFKIGSLVDITSPVLPLSEINRILNFTTESAREAGLLV
jgi:hypothetical protein